MEVEVVNFKRSSIVNVKGRIDSSTSPELLRKFNTLIDDGTYRIVFNMNEVTFISSAGLRVLITTQKKCKRHNRGELVLSSVPENILAALDLAGFLPLFKIYTTDIEAVGNF
ncbi:MAG: hypothetical protein BGO78_00450 [Chloroflexi bacterium 44-23]|nr:MAG: hypothetical protein BGO78_00450 [Chloroflexi bacterium 44-23]